MQQLFSQHKPIVLRLNQLAPEAPELQDGLDAVNRDWSRARSFLQQWDASLRKTLTNCQEFHESLHSLLLWLDHAECRSRPASLSQPNTPLGALQQHRDTLIDLREELRRRRAQQASLQLLWSQLQPEEAAEDSRETPEKLRATGSKLKLLLRPGGGRPRRPAAASGRC
ncbi:nesprin-2-like [Takifugu rubripes]|uniref:nesprin-2-like n=1 Tax=Takifugu rubripes TaxID=31033 RepID=UPI001145798B|nr:nesprin-2-like [Takifugu rubripes]